MDEKLYTCSCCGFKVFKEVFSTCEICEICSYEDDITSCLNIFEPLSVKGKSLIDLQRNILKKYPTKTDKIIINNQIYYRNNLWKPLDIKSFDKKHNYFPEYKFEEFKEKYPKHYDYFEELMLEAQKYNPDEKVHLK